MKEQLAEGYWQLPPELEALLKPTTAIGALKHYVDRIVIPKMNATRGRTESMPGDRIVDKLFSTDQNKPGEVVELTQALYQNKTGFIRDPVEVALEVADIIYYTRQPNIPYWIQNPKPLIEGLSLTYGDALAFCSLKYSVRLNSQENTNRKQKEYRAMQDYLENHGPRSFFDHHLFGRISFVNTQ